MKKIHRKPKAINLHEAKEVGILFDATTIEKYELVRPFIAFLQEMGIRTHVLGFINDKKIPESYLLRRNFHFFSKQELNWYFHPVSHYVNEFMERPLDILFYLDIEGLFPLRYIASLSKARFKVGLYGKQIQHLDFMIDLKKEESTIQNLIEQINAYLLELNFKPLPY